MTQGLTDTALPCKAILSTKAVYQQTKWALTLDIGFLLILIGSLAEYVKTHKSKRRDRKMKYREGRY